MVTYLAVYTESKNDSPAFSIWDTYQQALNAKVPEGMILWDVIGIKDDDRAKHQQNPAFIPAKEFPANRYDAEGVVYTGNYQTDDDYNPYKYVNQAPFGSEEICLNWTPTIDERGKGIPMGGPCWDCKVCSEQGRTPQKFQQLKDTGWFKPDGTPKGIRDSDYGIQSSSNQPPNSMFRRKDDYEIGGYNPSERDAEEYPFEEIRKINYARLDAQKERDPWAWDKEETLIRLEPIENLNMKGVGGILLAIVGILLWQA